MFNTRNRAAAITRIFHALALVLLEYIRDGGSPHDVYLLLLFSWKDEPRAYLTATAARGCISVQRRLEEGGECLSRERVYVSTFQRAGVDVRGCGFNCARRALARG